MKAKKKRSIKIISLIVAVALAISATGLYFYLTKEEPVKYPYVLVHGLYGWGDDNDINNVTAYWGATTGSLKDYLTEQGYDVYEASVGPFNSTWDRACELYAQLTGTTVDYGEAHSKEHNHDRYGEKYTVPLFEGWGTKTPRGQINKINLIGHSFGGNTIRLLTHLLEYGDENEKNSGTENISELFKGGHGKWVNSVTTLCSPSNGSTLYYAFDENNIVSLLMSASYSIAGLSNFLHMGEFLNFHLDHFGITTDEDTPVTTQIANVLKVIKESGNDNAAYELSPDGAAELNEKIQTVESVYYFSYTYKTTERQSKTGHQIPVEGTLLPLKYTSKIMGALDENTVTDYKIDETWLENDGLVNVVSAKYPFDEKWKNYNSEETVTPGIWNVMPVREGDHGTVIGLNADTDETHKFYDDLFDMIEKLERIN